MEHKKGADRARVQVYIGREGGRGREGQQGGRERGRGGGRQQTAYLTYTSQSTRSGRESVCRGQAWSVWAKEEQLGTREAEGPAVWLGPQGAPGWLHVTVPGFNVLMLAHTLQNIQ